MRGPTDDVSVDEEGEDEELGVSRLVSKLDSFLSSLESRQQGDGILEEKRRKEVRSLQGIRHSAGNVLHSYQEDGVLWLVDHYLNDVGAIVADEMGLGKTLQSLAFVCWLNEVRQLGRPSLVVCPLSVVSSWEAQLREFVATAPPYIRISEGPDHGRRSASNLRVLTYVGTAEERHCIREKVADYMIRQSPQAASRRNQAAPFDLLLTTYETLMCDMPFFSMFEWECLFFDEASRLKSKNSKRRNAFLHRLRRQHVVMMTGTPVEKNLEELWSLLQFVQPDLFTSSTALVNAFCSIPPSLRQGDQEGKKEAPRVQRIQRNKDLLQRLVKAFILRRRLSQVKASWTLPSLVELVVFLPLTPLQRRLYFWLLTRESEALEAVDDLGTAFEQLRKCCNHPALFRLHASPSLATFSSSAVATSPPFDPERAPGFCSEAEGDDAQSLLRDSSKIAALDAILNFYLTRQEKVVVFSFSTAMLDLVEDFLDEKGIVTARLDGSMSDAERRAAIAAFSAEVRERRTEKRYEKQGAFKRDTSERREPPPNGVEETEKDTETRHEKPQLQYETQREPSQRPVPPDEADCAAVFLVSVRAGGYGLTLSHCASVCVFLEGGGDGNPQIERQAIARLYRQGQTKKVKVIRLITKSTVEEVMYWRGRQKLKLASDVLSEDETEEESERQGRHSFLCAADMKELITCGLSSLTTGGDGAQRQTQGRQRKDEGAESRQRAEVIVEGRPHVETAAGRSGSPAWKKTLSLSQDAENSGLDLSQLSRLLADAELPSDRPQGDEEGSEERDTGARRDTNQLYPSQQRDREEKAHVGGRGAAASVKRLGEISPRDPDGEGNEESVVCDLSAQRVKTEQHGEGDGVDKLREGESSIYMYEGKDYAGVLKQALSSKRADRDALQRILEEARRKEERESHTPNQDAAGSSGDGAESRRSSRARRAPLTPAELDALREDAERRRQEARLEQWRANGYVSRSVQGDSFPDDSDWPARRAAVSEGASEQTETEGDEELLCRYFHYRTGDASLPRENPPGAIVHFVDAAGTWLEGRGFFKALDRLSAVPRTHLALAKKMGDLRLGDCHLVPVNACTFVAFCVCLKRHKQRMSLSLPLLRLALQRLHDRAAQLSLSLHLPRCIVPLPADIDKNPRLPSHEQSSRAVEKLVRALFSRYRLHVFVYRYRRAECAGDAGESKRRSRDEDEERRPGKRRETENPTDTASYALTGRAPAAATESRQSRPAGLSGDGQSREHRQKTETGAGEARARGVSSWELRAARQAHETDPCAPDCSRAFDGNVRVVKSEGDDATRVKSEKESGPEAPAFGAERLPPSGQGAAAHPRSAGDSARTFGTEVQSSKGKEKTKREGGATENASLSLLSANKPASSAPTASPAAAPKPKAKTRTTAWNALRKPPLAALDLAAPRWASGEASAGTHVITGVGGSNGVRPSDFAGREGTTRCPPLRPHRRLTPAPPQGIPLKKRGLGGMCMWMHPAIREEVALYLAEKVEHLGGRAWRCPASPSAWRPEAIFGPQATGSERANPARLGRPDDHPTASEENADREEDIEPDGARVRAPESDCGRVGSAGQEMAEARRTVWLILPTKLLEQAALHCQQGGAASASRPQRRHLAFWASQVDAALSRDSFISFLQRHALSVAGDEVSPEENGGDRLQYAWSLPWMSRRGNAGPYTETATETNMKRDEGTLREALSRDSVYSMSRHNKARVSSQKTCPRIVVEFTDWLESLLLHKGVIEPSEWRSYQLDVHRAAVAGCVPSSLLNLYSVGPLPLSVAVTVRMQRALGTASEKEELLTECWTASLDAHPDPRNQQAMDVDTEPETGTWQEGR
ncbi:putative SNF2 family N-terminal domain-containing protein [Neospora caninum Liverpool]|uniref:Putative SNF2 family N-terminal domain-containing protein n=1 Tax=Neospora caninum (strain Liverpool) TaxID=572307 RepID=F0VC94_NEOCL|nr:putative SNF2 family N-terminal domain-containing protein [Neospora caninum Liverpool]CBZ51228.1 putative SNF2 family N-terminal domain-containing protein [Neospora caninum Liverpool]|eukprot:XP_003881261.1 putative SNF2 family N-terminal domain-containing protein [Neospora caninum Liverpool]